MSSMFPVLQCFNPVQICLAYKYGQRQKCSHAVFLSQVRIAVACVYCASVWGSDLCLFWMLSEVGTGSSSSEEVVASAHGMLAPDSFPRSPLNSIACNLNMLHPEPHTKLHNMVSLDGQADVGLEERFLTLFPLVTMVRQSRAEKRKIAVYC